MGRILLYTTEGSGLCATARAIVRSWDVCFYEICLSRHPERVGELEELSGSPLGVPQLFFNSLCYPSLQAILQLSRLPTFPSLLQACLDDDSPSFPLLPDDSFVPAGFLPSRPALADEQMEFLSNQTLLFRLLSLDPPLFQRKRRKVAALSNILCLRGSKLSRWLKAEMGEATGSKVASSFLSSGFLVPADGGQPRFDPKGFYSVAFSERLPNISLNTCVRCPVSANVQALPLSVELHSVLGRILDAFMRPSGEVSTSEALVSPLWFELEQLALKLQLVRLEGLSRSEQKVFYINLYHVLRVHAEIRIGRPRSHVERVRFFDEVGYQVGSDYVTLNSIDYIRLLRGFDLAPPSTYRSWALVQGDPRVHFALQDTLQVSPVTCIYRMSSLETALDHAVRLFVQTTVHLDPKASSIQVPRLFRWYADCFSTTSAASTAGTVLNWLILFHPVIAAFPNKEKLLVAYSDEEFLKTQSRLAENTGSPLEEQEGEASLNSSLPRRFVVRDSISTLLDSSSEGSSALSESDSSINSSTDSGVSPRLVSRTLSARGPIVSPRRMSRSSGRVMESYTVQFGNVTSNVFVHQGASVWDLKVATWSATNIGLPTKLVMFGPHFVKLENAAALASQGVVPGAVVPLKRDGIGSQPSSASLFVSTKRSIAPSLCFLGGRGLSNGVVGVRATFLVYLVDSSYVIVSPTAALQKLLEVHIIQGRKELSAVIAIVGDHFEVSFVPDSSGGSSYKVFVRINGKEASGSPFMGRLLDLSNPHEALRTLCHLPEWGFELASACQLMVDPMKEIGSHVLVDLVLANKNNPDALSLLVTVFGRDDIDWEEYFRAAGRVGVLALAILGMLGVSSEKMVLKAPLPVAALANICRTGGRAFLALLEASCSSLQENSADTPGIVELGDMLLQALVGSECFGMAAMIFNAIIKFPVLDKHLLASLADDRPYVRKLFSCRSPDAMLMSLESLYRLLQRNPQFQLLQPEILRGLVEATRSGNSPIESVAFDLVFLVLSEVNVVDFASLALEASIHESLMMEQSFVEYSWQRALVAVFSSRQSKSNSIASDIAESDVSKVGVSRVHRLLLCLSSFYQFSRSVESLRPKFSTVLMELLLSLTMAVDSSVRRLAWNCLLEIVVRHTDADGPIKTASFFQKVYSAVREAVSSNHMDFGGVPFEILLTAKAEMVRRESVIMFARLLAQDEPWRQDLTLALGKTFLASYISAVATGDYTPAEIRLDPAEVKLGKLIGSGVSGTVYRGTWRNQEVAVKTLKEDSLSFSEKDFLSELALMTIVRHRHVVHLLGGCAMRGTGEYYLVSKLYTKGSLDGLLESKADANLFTPQRIHTILLQVARAMKYLHSLSVIHRDLKPGNILVDADCNVAVCDFGVSRCVDLRTMTRGVGTPLFTAPEVLEGTSYNASADVYSYGICAWQVLARKEPFSGINFMQLVPKILEGLRPPLDIVDSQYRDLLESCWAQEIRLRPPFYDVVNLLKGMQKKPSIKTTEAIRRHLKNDSSAGVHVRTSLRTSQSEVSYDE